VRIPAIWMMRSFRRGHGPGHHGRHDRGRRVVDARKARADVLLGPREQQERHDAERECEHAHVHPHHESPGQGLPTDGHEDPERHRAEHEPRPCDLGGREPAERDLHEQETGAPDDAGQHELHGDDRLAGRSGGARDGKHAPTLVTAADAPALSRMRCPKAAAGRQRAAAQGTGWSASYARKPGLRRTSTPTSAMMTIPPSSGGNHSAVRVARLPA